MSAQDVALAALRADIGSGALAPGAQVIQESLAEGYGVSRVPLREALKTLAAEGQVVYHPNRGYFVAELDVDDLLEVYRLREVLEGEAITQGVPRLTDQDLARLADLHGRMLGACAAGDVVELTEANREFHFVVFDAARMPRLSRLIRQLWQATDVYRTIYFDGPANRDRVDREHAAMLRALRRRDAERVLRLHADHRRHAVSAVRREVERDR